MELFNHYKRHHPKFCQQPASPSGCPAETPCASVPWATRTRAQERSTNLPGTTQEPCHFLAALSF